MKIETWPIDKLKNWDQNPRNVSKEALDRLKVQLHDLDLYKPLLIHTDGTVLGGNMRLRALKEQGVKDVTVSIVDAPDEETKLKYALSDNDQVGYTDKEKLLELVEKYPNLELTHYAVHLQEPERLDAFMSQFQEVEEDEAPAIDETQTVSQLGEVYQLGRHRLMCGDSTRVDTVEKLMNGNKADIIFTDPPYGYSYKSNYQDKHDEILNDDKILNFLPFAFEYSNDNAPFYVFCGWQTVDKWIEQIHNNNLKLKNIIIWKKNNWSMGDLEGTYAGQYEMLVFAHKGRVEIQGERDRDIWEFDRVPPTDHPTMKPVELCAKAINNHTGNIVLDLFGGSGSTLIAAQQTDRTCYMMELDPKYCDVIRKRYAKFIDKEDQWQEITPKI